ncbi:MAG: hypothetical protein JNL57_03980 [Bacteroidetes bacterium]|nr:hypothetical protein [Bacteroidota bacterium]
MLICVFTKAQSQKQRTLRWKSDTLNSHYTEKFDDSTLLNCQFHKQFIWCTNRGKAALKINQHLAEISTGIAYSDADSFRDEIKNQNLAFRQAWQQDAVNPSRTDSFYSSTNNWYSISDMKVIFEDRCWLTIQIDNESYVGGETVHYKTQLATFFKHKGTRICRWQELVTDTLALLRLAEARFRTEKNIPDEEHPFERWFNGGPFQLCQNFGFTTEGLLFIYNNCEIASCSEGGTDLLIPRKHLNKYLKK